MAIPFHAFVTTRIDTHRWPDSLGGGAGPARDVKQPARGFGPFDHKNKEVF